MKIIICLYQNILFEEWVQEKNVPDITGTQEDWMKFVSVDENVETEGNLDDNPIVEPIIGTTNDED